MQKSLVTASFLAVVAGAVTTGAQTIPMAGSDTLEAITADLIGDNCDGAAAYSGLISPFLSYIGGGSGNAPNAMIAQLTAQSDAQLAGPMSRPLSATECTNAAATGATLNASGIVLALDGVAIVADSQNSAACGGTHTTGQTPGPDAVGYSSGPNYSEMLGFQGTFPYAGGTYTLGGGAAQPTPWKDLLRLLFTGLRNSDANPASSAATLRGNCASPERRALAASYSLLFKGGCTSGACTELRHLFRRGDLSGTTDTFLALIGAPSNVLSSGKVTKTAMCNGLENQDIDPIRRPCIDGEQVCEADGSLGLLLPIVVPTTTNDVGILFNAANSPGGNALGDVARFGKIKITPGPSCVNAPTFDGPNPAGALDAAKPDATTTVAGWNLPTGFRFPNNPRCDCRYPTPEDYLTVRDPANAVVAFPKNNAFAWNKRSGGCPAVYRANGADGGTEPPARFGLLNGQDPNGDNSPSYWGTTFISGTKRVCCTNNAKNYTMDPRSMNLQLRDPAAAAGGALLGGVSAPVSTTAFYRIHSTSRGRNVIPNRSTQAFAGANDKVCQDTDATRQIGLLVQKPGASNCSIGFAGRESVESNTEITAEALGIVIDDPAAPGTPKSIGPTQADIAKLVDANATVRAAAYPLSRKLYYNTLIGFGATRGAGHLVGSEAPSGTNHGPAQYALGKCFADAAASSAAVTRAGFLPVPGGPKLCLNMCGANSSCTTLTNINLASPNFQ